MKSFTELKINGTMRLIPLCCKSVRLIGMKLCDWHQTRGCSKFLRKQKLLTGSQFPQQGCSLMKVLLRVYRGLGLVDNSNFIRKTVYQKNETLSAYPLNERFNLTIPEKFLVVNFEIFRVIGNG